jgi:hypothetical protein
MNTVKLSVELDFSTRIPAEKVRVLLENVLKGLEGQIDGEGLAPELEDDGCHTTRISVSDGTDTVDKKIASHHTLTHRSWEG